MLQTPIEKTCRQRYCDKSADAFEVAPNCACTDQSVLSRMCPALHAEISESPCQIHIPRKHAHLRRTIVSEPTSYTNGQRISLERCVVHSRLTHVNQILEGRTQHVWVARFQESSKLTRGFAQVMITRCPPISHGLIMKSLSDIVGQGRIAWCTDLKNTQSTKSVVSMHQKLSSRLGSLCAIVGSTGIVSVSRMSAQCLSALRDDLSQSNTFSGGHRTAIQCRRLTALGTRTEATSNPGSSLRHSLSHNGVP